MLAVENEVVPTALLNRPTLQGFDIEVWNAFSRLSSRRPVNGFGSVGAIPYVEIAAYLDIILNIEDREDRAFFIDLIEFLDVRFLKEHAERQRQEAAKAKNKPAKRSKS